ncbi:HK97 family phage prohead protease [Agromyces sp. S2-1-8]|uniref:HK97 family phage prohead protease n=1 Tax=Agromyces sp. S2-1-8 TaxID=2897180 RepID=UPI001E2FCDA1|nr:HK97 family phage prohead protease [Agromyces sp. S2-1-8]MCD5345055.1 HK97 family phage prohead protease [Agromyces sp. S2-1-8]
MPDLDRLLAEHCTRELEIRSADVDRREITGIAVPWNQRADIGGWFTEEFERGAVQDSDGALYLYRHDEPIGRVTKHRDTDAGWEITAVVSATRAGDDALTLARDGVVTKHSVGFRFDQYEVDESGDIPHVTHKRVQVHEVSLVPFPAYDGADVTDVRHALDRPTATQPKENNMDPELEQLRADVDDTRDTVEELERRFAVGLNRDPDPVADTRSAGEWLRAIVTGDADTIREYEQLVERAYAGGTSADGILTPQYVGDTIRLIEAPNMLGQIFSTAPLPSKGMKLEYGVLESDNVDVAEQLAEGEDLTSGKIVLDVDHADIKTYGGYVELTRQKIERTTNVNVLNLHLRALGLRAARRKATVLRAHYAAAVAAQAALGEFVDVTDPTKYVDWVAGIVDAAEIYQDLGLPLDALVADKTVFKALASLTSTDGRPLMSITGTGVNTVGTIAPKALGGNLASVEVRVNLKQAAPGAAFVNGEAIRQYNSPIVELADENIVNLSKRFGLYYYGSLATEIPAAIVPISLAGSIPDVP